MHRVCAWLCTKDYMPVGKTCTKGGCRERFCSKNPKFCTKLLDTGNRTLWVELTKVFDIPGIAHWNAIFRLQADCAGPGDPYYPIRAFPLRRQLVGILGRLNAPKNKVAFLKTPGTNLAAMVAAQSLLVACSSHSSPKTVFLKEHSVILPQLLLLELIISEHSR